MAGFIRGFSRALRKNLIGKIVKMVGRRSIQPQQEHRL
jgi:hypothetical protein